MNKTFSAQLENLEDMIRFVETHARKVGFSKQNMFRLELSTEEVLVNVIKHGYPEDRGDINIACSLPDDNTLKIIITDYGISFDPIANAKNVDTNAPLEKRTYGGYGIFLVLKVMDEVDYKRKNNANVLTMIKRRQKKTSPS